MPGTDDVFTELPPGHFRRANMKRILLVRHGESREQSGETRDGVNPVLSARGERQIETLRARLAGCRFDTVYVSPLARAWQTFAGAGVECRRAVYDSRIIEIEWRPGWYGAMPGEPPPAQAAPDREHAWLLPTYERIASFLTEVAADADRLIALFGHQGAFRCLIELFLHLPRSGEPIRLQMDNCAVSELAIAADGSRYLRYWNDFHHVAHLL
jgi:broad specificity phosphatase PhoE